MTKITSKVSIAAAAAFFVAAAFQLLAHATIWATCWILLGIGLILAAIGLNPPGVRRRVTRGLSLGFAGAALILLVIGSVQFFSQL
jgi:hypothetical protein